MVAENFTTHINPYLIIVEDDLDDQDLILEICNRIAFKGRVKMLSDGDQLFELLDRTTGINELPTLIVLDYNLPRLGGEATLVLLKKDIRYRNIPVVIYSTSMTLEKEHQLLSLGANFCRKKPSTIDGIIHMIGEFIGFATMLYKKNHVEDRPVK